VHDPGLALSLADGPQAGDQVIEEADVQVFVQPDPLPPSKTKS
jgi:hypothetical protein